jgi:hypothetical protein
MIFRSSSSTTGATCSKTLPLVSRRKQELTKRSGKNPAIPYQSALWTGFFFQYQLWVPINIVTRKSPPPRISQSQPADQTQ